VSEQNTGDQLRVDGCQHCDVLWERYRGAVLEYTRLGSKLKLARLRYEQEIEKLQAKLGDAEQERNDLRRQIVEHEQAMHPETKTTVFA
jgi:hypothetical protein